MYLAMHGIVVVRCSFGPRTIYTCEEISLIFEKYEYYSTCVAVDHHHHQAQTFFTQTFLNYIISSFRAIFPVSKSKLFSKS